MCRHHSSKFHHVDCTSKYFIDVPIHFLHLKRFLRETIHLASFSSRPLFITCVVVSEQQASEQKPFQRAGMNACRCSAAADESFNFHSHCAAWLHVGGLSENASVQRPKITRNSMQFMLLLPGQSSPPSKPWWDFTVPPPSSTIPDPLAQRWRRRMPECARALVSKPCIQRV